MMVKLIDKFRTTRSVLSLSIIVMIVLEKFIPGKR